jgi:hypothetical protein
MSIELQVRRWSQYLVKQSSSTGVLRYLQRLGVMVWESFYPVLDHWPNNLFIPTGGQSLPQFCIAVRYSIGLHEDQRSK